MFFTYPPPLMQLYGDPGVFIPNQSYPTARHRDDSVQSPGERVVEWAFLQTPAFVETSGHPPITQCQRDFSLDGTRGSDWCRII